MTEHCIETSPFTLIHGNSLEKLRDIEDASVDSVVTDAPYELGFMGKSWDASGVAYNVDMWREALRVLKPGGHLLCFGGSRTYHRMACAIEDAGFEIRDQIMWIYGSGMPKGEAWTQAKADKGGAESATMIAAGYEGWARAGLKPAHEPICVARKPFPGNVANNVLAFGVGAINVDACRISTEDVLAAGAGKSWSTLHKFEGREGEASADRRYGAGGNDGFAMLPGARQHAAGRWPANVIHDGSDEVVTLFPENSGQSGALKTRKSDKTRNTFGAFAGTESANFEAHDAKGSAARFFYCAKANREDRNDGCEALPQKIGGMVSNTSGQHLTRRDEAYKARPMGNHHPTVKPTDLMAYLVRLVTKPGGVVLDPFMGSGSTGKACMREGLQFVGIDMSAEYVQIAKSRIEHEHIRVTEAAALAAIPAPQLDLFQEAANA